MKTCVRPGHRSRLGYLNDYLRDDEFWVQGPLGRRNDPPHELDRCFHVIGRSGEPVGCFYANLNSGFILLLKEQRSGSGRRSDQTAREKRAEAALSLRPPLVSAGARDRSASLGACDRSRPRRRGPAKAGSRSRTKIVRSSGRQGSYFEIHAVYEAGVKLPVRQHIGPGA